MAAGLTRTFREELARVQERRPCCRIAVLAGLMHTAGSFLIKGGASEADRYEVRLSTTVQAAAKMAFSQFKSFGADGELLTHREPRFHQRLIYELRLKGSPSTLQALNEMGVLSDSFQLQPGIARRLVKQGAAGLLFCAVALSERELPTRRSEKPIWKL